jgi:hypothetical protein
LTYQANKLMKRVKMDTMLNTYSVITLKNGKRVCDYWTVASLDIAIEVTKMKRGKNVEIVKSGIFQTAVQRQQLLNDAQVA